MNHSIPASHGATAVARASFGTVIIVGSLLFFGSIWTDQGFLVYLSIFTGICGALFGYYLWSKNYYIIATSINAGGLIFSAGVAYVYSAKLGGPTSILLLASVITAGGLLGRKGAIIDMCIAFFVIILGYVFGDDIRVWLYIPIQGHDIEEKLTLIFVVSSLPSWGAYVVAIDASNRKAWQQYFVSNQTLLEQQKLITTAKKQQEEVAHLGLIATGDSSLHILEQRCWTIIQKHFPEAKENWSYLIQNEGISEINISKIEVQDTSQQLFLSSLTQVLRARTLRESILQERAELANRLQREERLEALSRMAGGVAHDFNNALSLLVSIADEFVSDSSLPQHVRSGMETSLEATRHASELTKQLLLFSQGIPLENTPIQPVDVLYEILPILKRMLQHKGELHIDVQPNKHTINMRKENLERIFFNLIQNSADAMREDGWVRITMDTNLSQSPQMTISVIDNGEGMPKNIKDKAIEPYFSGREGTGLGLSTVHGLVEQVRGTLKIQSSHGVGTTIEITIPAQETTEKNITSSQIPHKKERYALLIDDEPFVRVAVEMLLRRLGWEVFSAKNREEACQHIHSPLSLIVCDIRLVEDTGYEVVEALREKGLEAPVLYITGYAGVGHTSQNIHMLIKPFRLRDLEQALSTLLVETPSLENKA